LSQAKIPWISTAISTSDLESPYSFPVDGGVVSPSLNIARVAKQINCSNVGFVGLDLPISHLFGDYLGKAMAAGGGKSTSLYVPVSGVASYASQVAKLANSGVDCYSNSMASGESVKLINAVNQAGKKWIPIIPAPDIASVLDSLVKSQPNLITVSDFYLSSDTDVPAVQSYLAAVQKYKPGTKQQVQNAIAWVEAQLLRAALSAATSLDSAGVLSALNSLKNVDVGLTATLLDTTQHVSVKGLTRLINPSSVTYKVENGKFVRSGTFGGTLADVTRILG
jgi:hypothetical protein